MAMLPFPCFATIMLTMQSGTLVPAAQNVSPIMAGLIPSRSPALVAHWIMKRTSVPSHTVDMSKFMPSAHFRHLVHLGDVGLGMVNTTNTSTIIIGIDKTHIRSPAGSEGGGQFFSNAPCAWSPSVCSCPIDSLSIKFSPSPLSSETSPNTLLAASQEHKVAVTLDCEQ